MKQTSRDLEIVLVKLGGLLLVSPVKLAKPGRVEEWVLEGDFHPQASGCMFASICLVFIKSETDNKVVVWVE